MAISASAAVLATLLTWALVMAAKHARETPGRRWFGQLAEGAGSLILVMPPIVIGAGWFVLLRRWTDVFAVAPLVVIAVNALMAIPYATRILAPAVAEAAQAHDRLSASLGLAGWNRFRLVDWPTLRRPLSMALAFAAALSLGDLGAIALFGSQDVITLPLLLLQRMGSYRTIDAQGLAVFLALLCLALIVAGDILGRARR
jgi:thiamine transport system permease protein